MQVDDLMREIKGIDLELESNVFMLKKILDFSNFLDDNKTILLLNAANYSTDAEAECQLNDFLTQKCKIQLDLENKKKEIAELDASIKLLEARVARRGKESIETLKREHSREAMNSQEIAYSLDKIGKLESELD